MKNAIKEIVGKRITGVVVKEGHHPASQVFLVFDDATCYELYASSKINGINGVDRGGMAMVRKYLTPPNNIVLQHCEDD